MICSVMKKGCDIGTAFPISIDPASGPSSSSPRGGQRKCDWLLSGLFLTKIILFFYYVILLYYHNTHQLEIEVADFPIHHIGVRW